MRKIFWIFMLGLLPMGVFAQGFVSFGPKVGWNTDKLTTDYSQYMKDLKSGFQGGLFLSVYIKKFYVQPEAYFSLKRGALQTTIGNPFDPATTLSISQTISLKTIDVPVLVGYKFLDLKLVRFRIWGGPVVSYILNKDFVFAINGTNKSDRITRDDFKDAIWSAQIGAGVDVLMLTFDIGYEFGLDSFLTIHSLDNFNFRNNMFYCSLGWRLF